MYLQNIAIKNIGPIDELSMEFPLNGNGNPKPVILVGENGSGKTIFQSQIIDAFYEIGGQLFDNIYKQQGLGYEYYKLSGATNLKLGKDNGFSILRFIDNDKNKIEYCDRMGDIKQEDIEGLINDYTLPAPNKVSSPKSTTGITEPSKPKLQAEWLSGVYFYQPAYRFEEPFWQNKTFTHLEKFVDKKEFSGKLYKEIEITSSMEANKSFLMDLVLDFINNKHIIDSTLLNNINRLISKIKKMNNIRLGIGPRRGYRVSVVEDINGTVKSILPSVDNLSLGESILFNLFINIIRHADNPPKNLDEIHGIVAIDEIDVHLHVELQHSVLPELIKLFPKVQFILTTHSPMFLLGMQKTLGEDGFEIRNMPTGELISAERFAEFENAYTILKETEKFETEKRSIIDNATKPILFVEGDYDKRYIEKASELLGESDILCKIQIFDANGYGGLDSIWRNYNPQLSEVVPQDILLLYDCDTQRDASQRGKLHKKTIPLKEEHSIKKGIENLFSDIIERARTYKAAFIDCKSSFTKTIRGVQTVEPETLEVNKDEKGNLCTWICPNGSKEDFRHFEIIFGFIKDTILPEDEAST